MDKSIKPNSGSLTRRQFVGSLAAAGATVPLHHFPTQAAADLAPAAEPIICVFSKHLQWLSLPEVGAVAKEIGFDGIDLTVRKGGHVEPAHAAAELPKAVEALKKAGLQVPMMATDIVDADHPDTAVILKTAADNGIRYYRTGYLKYDPAISVAKNLDIYKKQISKLAALNQKYSIHGAYQNHSGTNVGAAVWDLWELLKDIDPRWMGCQYDIKHAVAEGGMSWVNGLDVLKPHIHCMDIKDFVWAKKEGKWYTRVVPLGEGMVDYKAYLTQLKKHNITGPFSVHYEFPLGGADTGKKQITISREEVLTAMKRDLVVLRSLIEKF